MKTREFCRTEGGGVCFAEKRKCFLTVRGCQRPSGTEQAAKPTGLHSLTWRLQGRRWNVRRSCTGKGKGKNEGKIKGKAGNPVEPFYRQSQKAFERRTARKVKNDGSKKLIKKDQKKSLPTNRSQVRPGPCWYGRKGGRKDQPGTCPV